MNNNLKITLKRQRVFNNFFQKVILTFLDGSNTGSVFHFEEGSKVMVKPGFSRLMRKVFLSFIFLFGMSLGGCDNLELILVPDFAQWSVEQTGYEIENLPVYITASFVRGNDVYLSDGSGELFKADDTDLSKPWQSVGKPFNGGARLLFVSSGGVIFASRDNDLTFRSDDMGKTWRAVLPVPAWRMTEDDRGNLYIGNYCKTEGIDATVYKSTNGGVSWVDIYHQNENHHIHTIGWDDRAKRLYIAFGDTARRGQAYSDNYGETFKIIAQGRDEGNTDVAFTRDYVIWASDDQSGRVFRVSRETGNSETLMGQSQFMWFAVAKDEQIYVGTMTSKEEGGERACLLASSDQGTTWQKLLETDLSTGPYNQGFFAESRQLSSNGWLYCSNMNKSYRIRRIAN
jgi:photosystem II stability/assembly factor-like uncharacterized protein